MIVHYRTPSDTVASARAVAETAPDAEILVVDNASGDDVGERLAREVPRARVIAEPANRGYGAACNRGARKTARPYLLLLNSDACVRPGAVAAANVSAIGSLIIAPVRSATRVKPRLSHHASSSSIMPTSAEGLRKMM